MRGKHADWTGARFPVPNLPLYRWQEPIKFDGLLPLVKSVWLFTHAVVPAIALSLLIQPNFFNKGSTNLVLWVFSALLENEKTLGTRLREARRRCARGFIGIRKIRSRRFPFPLCFSSSPWPRCGSSLQRSIDDRVQMKRRLGRVKYASDQL